MTSILRSDSLQLPRLGAHPAAAPTGFCYIYILDSDGAVYLMDDSGTEVELGSGGGGGATDFTDLGDVPASYTSQALKYVRVNAGETALEFITPPAMDDTDAIHIDEADEYDTATVKSVPAGADRLLIEDSADSFNKKYIQIATINDSDAIHVNVNSEYTAAGVKSTPTSSDRLLIEDDADSGNKKVIQIGNLPGSAATFLALTDTPADYTGDGLKLVRVNAGETALEFTDPPSGGGADNFIELGDVPASYTGEAGKFVRVTSGEDALEFVAPPTGGTGSLVTVGEYADTRPSSPNDGDTFIATDGYYKEIFFDSAWHYFWRDQEVFPAPAVGTLTQTNVGDKTLGNPAGVLEVIASPNLGTDNAGILSTPISGAYDLKVLVHLTSPGISNYFMGAAAIDSTTEEFVGFGIEIAEGVQNAVIMKWTDSVTYDSNETRWYASLAFFSNPFWFRIENTGAARKFWWLPGDLPPDSPHWFQIGEMGATDWVTEDEVGVFIAVSQPDVRAVLRVISWVLTP